jgi:hypothetical protein
MIASAPMAAGRAARDSFGENDMQVFLVEWECGSCGQKHSFRHAIQDEDVWPNKFELSCENSDCGQEQDVPFRACTVTALNSE